MVYVKILQMSIRIEDLPEIIQAIEKISRVNPNFAGTISGKDHGRPDLSDIEQLQILRKVNNVHRTSGVERVLEDAFVVSFGALVRLGQEPQDTMSRRERRTIKRNTKEIAKHVVFDSLRRAEKLEESKDAIEKLIPVLPRTQRSRARHLLYSHA